MGQASYLLLLINILNSFYKGYWTIQLNETLEKFGYFLCLKHLFSTSDRERMDSKIQYLFKNGNDSFVSVVGIQTSKEGLVLE